MNPTRILRSTRRALTAVPMALALLAGTALLTTGTPATAAEKIDPNKPSVPPATSIVNIYVAGTVVGEPEDVVFPKVQVAIGSTLIPVQAPGEIKRLALDVTVIKAAGAGLESKKKYVATFYDHLLEVYEPALVVDRTFAFGLDEKGLYPDLAGRLLLNLTFDDDGVITGATGTIDAIPPFEEPVDPLIDPATL